MRSLLFSVLIIIGGLTLLSACAPVAELPVEEAVDYFTFGEVRVYRENAEIRFEATVKNNESWVQHLIYLQGYRWLEEKSAIVSNARLTELQHGLALLDWKLWDELWQGIDSEKAYDVRVYLKYDGEKIQATDLVDTIDEIHIGDLIFLGCPYFDSVALSKTAQVDCTLCPVFPLEQEALSERFKRDGNESGYLLNAGRMFDIGSNVEIIIRLP